MVSYISELRHIYLFLEKIMCSFRVFNKNKLRVLKENRALCIIMVINNILKFLASFYCITFEVTGDPCNLIGS